MYRKSLQSHIRPKRTTTSAKSLSGNTIDNDFNKNNMLSGRSIKFNRSNTMNF